MITLRHTVSALAVSTLLVFSACKKKDSVDVDSATNAVEKVMSKVGGDKISVKSLRASDLDKYFKVKKRSSSSGDAALKSLGLDDGNGMMSWDSKSGSDGNYVYKEVRLKSGDGDNLAIDRMELSGVHFDGDKAATFDVMSLTGLSIGTDQGKGTIGSLQMASPHPKVAANILNGLSQLKSLDDIDMDVDLDGEQAFGAFKIEKLNLTGDDGSASADVMGWGSDEDSGKSTFLVSNLKGQAISEDNVEANFSIKTISADGIDSELIKTITEFGPNPASFNPLNSGYGNIIVDDVTVKADALMLNMDGFMASSTQKGDVITEKTLLEPMTIRLDGDMNSADYAELKQIMDVIDMQEINLSGGSTTVKNKVSDTMEIKDAYLSMKDGFDLNYTAKMSGIANASENPDSMKVHRAAVKFKDHSITDKAFAFFGAQSGVTGDEMRAQIGGMVTLMSLGGQIPADITTPVSKFINNGGGTLSVDVNPATPLSMDALDKLQDPSQLKEMGISLKYEK